MRASYLDKKEDGEACCWLVRTTLASYISSLPENFSDYEIQRGLVKNRYLDDLVETVLARSHIPPIVLVADSITDEAGSEVRVVQFDGIEILDGLQRSSRLLGIYKTIQMVVAEKDEIVDCFSQGKSALVRRYSVRLLQDSSSIEVLLSVLRKLSSGTSAEQLIACFETHQWFEVWTGLSIQRQVSKMLQLNAGHKTVTARHQLELLFVSLWPMLAKSAPDGFRVMREREVSALVFSKNRDKGQFHFAHLIAGLIALSYGKIITTNAELIRGLDSADLAEGDLAEISSEHLLISYTKFLNRLDSALAETFGSLGVQWLGREVVIVGLMAAIGRFAAEEGQSFEAVFECFLAKVSGQILDMNLAGFEEARNRTAINKVNLGAVNKRAVFRVIQEILSNGFSGKIDWHRAFGGSVDA